MRRFSWPLLFTIPTLVGIGCHGSVGAESASPAPSASASVPQSSLPAEVLATDAATEASDAAEDAAVATPEGMLLVPAGSFRMGADSGGEEDEHPAHRVTLPAFYLDRTEVTNDAYVACVERGACKSNDRTIASQTHAGPDVNFTGAKQPVVGVRWDDAKTFCASLGRRLPTEAEFERAIRGDDDRRFPWGNEAPTPDRAVYARPYGLGHTEDVGTHPSGRGPFGHDDLAGNVWEWMEDEYDPYAYRRASAGDGKPGTCEQILTTLYELRKKGKNGFTGSNAIPTDCEHVLRGGAYNYDAVGLRASNRVHHPGRFRLVMSGFRCAMTPPSIASTTK